VSILAIILIVLAVLLILLIGAGLAANARRQREGAGRLRAQLEQADHALAEARAQDRGWERETIERAARTTFGDRRPEEEISSAELIQVIDKPGTDADLAVWRIVATSGREEIVTLGRREGAWVSAEGL
jgi:type II secretory pathway pseudopilin PulG